MPRHHTIGYPAKEIAPVIVDGEVVTPGYMQPPYQEDVPFTEAEETARDAEAIEAGIERDAAIAVKAEKDGLQTKIDDGSIVFDELVRFLQL